MTLFASPALLYPPWREISGVRASLHVPQWNAPGTPSGYFTALTWPVRFSSLLGTGLFLQWGHMRFTQPILLWWDRLSRLCSQRICWASYRGSLAALWGWTSSADRRCLPWGMLRRYLISGYTCVQGVEALWLQSNLWTCAWGGIGWFHRILSGVGCRVWHRCFDTCRTDNVPLHALGWSSSLWRGLSMTG